MARRMKPAQRWGLFGLLAAIVLVVNLPVILMILNSLQTTEQLMTARTLLPTKPTLANFYYLSARTSFWTYLRNSIIVSGGCAALSVIAATLAGYALSRFAGRFLTFYARSLFGVQMFPIILALIPLFVLFRKLDLINNPLSVIILYTVFQLPFATWMARSFFDTIPRDLEEAAMVDGCSRLRTLVRIVLPLSVPESPRSRSFRFFSRTTSSLSPTSSCVTRAR
jgi:ABC-type glycerol-3-phosphate transport system permease component